MTQLDCLRPSMRVPSPMSSPRSSRSTADWVSFARFSPGRCAHLAGSSGVRSDIDSKEDLFRIRNRSWILFYSHIPDLGSEYGNQPYRGFHEQTVHPHCPGHRAQHQRVRHRASQRLIHNADDLRTMLRWRSGGTAALRSPQRLVHNANDLVALLRWRSGGTAALRSPQRLVHNANDLVALLRWRSGGTAALRSPQRLVHNANDLVALLRWRSGGTAALRSPQRLVHNANDLVALLRRRSGGTAALRSFVISEEDRYPLTPVDRLSDPRDGQ